MTKRTKPRQAASKSTVNRVQVVIRRAMKLIRDCKPEAAHSVLWDLNAQLERSQRR